MVLNVLVVGLSESIDQLFGARWHSLRNDPTQSLSGAGEDIRFRFWPRSTYSQLQDSDALKANFLNIAMQSPNGLDAILIAVYGDDTRTLITDEDGRYHKLLLAADSAMRTLNGASSLWSKRNSVLLFVTSKIPQSDSDQYLENVAMAQPTLLQYLERDCLKTWSEQQRDSADGYVRLCRLIDDCIQRPVYRDFSGNKNTLCSWSPCSPKMGAASRARMQRHHFHLKRVLWKLAFIALIVFAFYHAFKRYKYSNNPELTLGRFSAKH